MGNSGSQNTNNESILPDEKWAHSFPRSQQLQAKLHFQYKVLPEKTPKLKLRATNNGEILQSGGTISGRHIKTTEIEKINSCVQTFDERNFSEQKAYKKDISRSTAVQKEQHKFSKINGSSQQIKLFASEPDLRYALKRELREKKSKKKYKAPAPPKIRVVDDYKLRTKEETFLDPGLPIKKVRLFKTRAETKKQSSHLPDNTEDNLCSIEYPRANISKTPNKRLSLTEVASIDTSAFTRELKDVTQRLRCVEKEPKINPSSRIESETKKINVVVSKNLKSNFTETISDPPKNAIAHMREEASGKESTTPEMSPTLKPKYAINGSRSFLKPKQIFYFGMNENTKDCTNESVFQNLKGSNMQNSSESDISSDVESDETDTLRTGIDLQLRPILPKKQLEIPRFSPVAAWRLLSLDANENIISQLRTPTSTITLGSGSRIGAGGMVNSFEGNILTDDVPLLMEDHIEKYARPLPPLINAGQRSCNDKSGDSGISGDDAVPIIYCYDDDIVDADNDEEDVVNKMMIQDNRVIIRCRNKTERERISWTPQQDLDDSSGEEDLHNKTIKQRIRTHAGPHVFSLSLPRENHLAAYMTDKVQYSGIQKFKKSFYSAWGNFSNKKDLFNDTFLEERNNNWFLSKSAPNSLTNAIYSLERHKTVENNQPCSPSNTAKRLMYLPEIDLITKYNTKSSHQIYNNFKSKSCEDIASEFHKKYPEQLQDPKPKFDELSSWKIMRKPKKYTFQSTIRQIEKKRLSDKLSKEAEKRERERIRELNAMQKVEEEFQKKRASEKANIRQQLRLYSLDGDSRMQSPAKFDIKNKDRSEPDGAFSSDSSLSSNSPKKDFSKKITNLKNSNFDIKPTASSTKELSEFRQTQRDYKDYSSNLLKHTTKKIYSNKRTTIHPQVSYAMPQAKGLTGESYNYRKEFASGIRSVSTGSTYSEESQKYSTKPHNRKKQKNDPLPSSIYNNYFIPL